MTPSPLSVYLGAFLPRWRLERPDGGEEVVAPGLIAMLDRGPSPGLRAVVSDDRSHDRLADAVSGAAHGSVTVFAGAPRSLSLLRRERAWTGATSAAMVLSTLSPGLETALPSGLVLTGVARDASDPGEGVPLDAAVACVVRADPEENAERLIGFLGSDSSLTLLAAVDGDGEVRATSGYGLVDGHARIIMVDTDPGWRRRGIGAAMTAAALEHARHVGAMKASLNASDMGQSVYERLGFRSVGVCTRFHRRPDAS